MRLRRSRICNEMLPAAEALKGVGVQGVGIGVAAGWEFGVGSEDGLEFTGAGIDEQLRQPRAALKSVSSVSKEIMLSGVKPTPLSSMLKPRMGLSGARPGPDGSNSNAS